MFGLAVVFEDPCRFGFNVLVVPFSVVVSPVDVVMLEPSSVVFSEKPLFGSFRSGVMFGEVVVMVTVSAVA